MTEEDQKKPQFDQGKLARMARQTWRVGAIVNVNFHRWAASSGDQMPGYVVLQLSADGPELTFCTNMKKASVISSLRSIADQLEAGAEFPMTETGGRLH